AKLDGRGYLVRRQPLPTVRAQLLLARSLARFQHDPRLGHFTFDTIGNTGDPHFHHRRMRSDDLFDLARPHLEAAYLEHVLLAIDDEYVAVCIHVGEITRMDPRASGPMLAQRFSGFERVVPVLDHVLRRKNTHLAGLPRR